MRKFFILILLLLGFVNTHAQWSKVDSLGRHVVFAQKTRLPKFYDILDSLVNHEPVLKRVSFIDEAGTGPGFARPNGTVILNLLYLKNVRPKFNDDRMIIVLLHEIGHLYYYKNTPVAKRNPVDSEQAAFEYSLLKAKEMTDKGDCLPLHAGLKNMLERSKGKDTSDPHVIALRRLFASPLYSTYETNLRNACSVVHVN